MLKTTISIEGMMCGMCEAHVNDIIRKSFTVEKVSSSHSKNQTVVVSQDPLDEEALRKAITDLGYTYQGKSEEPYKKRKLFGF